MLILFLLRTLKRCVAVGLEPEGKLLRLSIGMRTASIACQVVAH